MPHAGDLVVISFPGVQGVKRRPALVVSSDAYHQNRPDAIVGLITSQVATATGPTDYLLEDWDEGGLHKPSAFRAYLWTIPQSALGQRIGRVTDRDRLAILDRVYTAIA